MKARSRFSGRRRSVPLPTLHLEFWVAHRKHRPQLSRCLRKTYEIARSITQAKGGSGPCVFIVDHDPRHSKTQRLRKTLGLSRDEELWVELTFYPSKTRMRAIMKKIWKQPDFLACARALERLISKRKPGYEATVAYAHRKAV